MEFNFMPFNDGVMESLSLYLSGGSEVWVLHDHQRIQTVKGKRGQPRNYNRVNSIISTGSENLGYIPDYNTLPTTTIRHHSPTHLDYSMLPHKPPTAGSSLATNSDNRNAPPAPSSAKELVLDLSDLDASLSTDQFSFKRPSRSRSFYEAFGTPRSQGYSPSLISEPMSGRRSENGHRKLSYSYPNISLPIDEQTSLEEPLQTSNTARPANSTGSKYVKHQTSRSHTDPSKVFSKTLPLPMSYAPDSNPWNTNMSAEATSTPKRLSGMRFGDSRVSYLTRLRLGETVRLQQQSKKKRKKLNPKGTIHYAFKADFK